MSNETNKTDSRRQFLKKTSAGVVISTLPATSVWGACTVSGALSGGSKVNDDCNTIPVLTNGRSHGSWKQILTHKNKLRSMFKFVQDAQNISDDAHEIARTAMICVIKPVLDLVIPLNDAGTETLSINEVNTGSGNRMQIATAYLNFHFGFYGDAVYIGSEQITSAEALARHMFAVAIANPSWEFSDAELGYDDGVSMYTPNLACI